MAPLSAPEKPKNGRLVLIAIVAVAAIIVVVAVAGYLYMEDQNKKSQLREELRQAFSDRQNESERIYTLIMAYPKMGNNNYVHDFRKWGDVYQQLTDNYSLAGGLIMADGAAYKAMLANESSDYANVTEACDTAQDQAKAVNSTAAGYEREYQGRMGLMTNASDDYNRALGQSYALYNTAWNFMQQNASYMQGGYYHDYLKACELNNSHYNGSIAAVESAGAIYQSYLKSDEYYTVNNTIQDLYTNITRLSGRYAELLKMIPRVTVTLNDEPLLSTKEGKYYLSQQFIVTNEDYPRSVRDVKVTFWIVDKADGSISYADAPVSVKMYRATTDLTDYNSCWVVVPCQVGHNYDFKYSVSFEY